MLIIALLPVILFCQIGCGQVPAGETGAASAARWIYTAAQPNGALSPISEDVADKTLVDKNDYVELYFNEKTCGVYIFDKRTGKWWSSNPDGENISEAAVKSQIALTTRNLSGVLNTYNSYSDAVAKGQIKHTVSGGILTVIYTMGFEGKDIGAIPQKLSTKRYAEISGRLDEEKQKQLKRYYSNLADDAVYVRREGLTGNQINSLAGLFEEAGYTSDEIIGDNADFGLEAAQSENKTFVVPVNYKLSGDSMEAEVELSGVSFPKSEPIVSLKLLEYFGALTEGGKGYLFIPDGSGAIIDSNAAHGNAGTYSAPVYGYDETLPVVYKSNKFSDITLPVFGVNMGDAGMIAVIEEGDAIAHINACKAGVVNDYASVCSSYEISIMQNIGLSGDDVSKFFKTPQKKYEGDIRVRYIFLERDNADYSGMARIYRGHLASNRQLKRIEKKNSIPLFIETAGAGKVTKLSFGIKHETYVGYTEYLENIKILEALAENGVDNIYLTLAGWTGGGLNQNLIKGADTLNVLGGEKDFLQLLDYSKANGISVFPKVMFNTFSSNEALLTKNKYVAVSLSRSKSEISVYDTVTGKLSTRSSGRMILSPRYYSDVANSFLKNFNGYGAGGLCIGDMSHTSYSDFALDNNILRTQSMEMAEGVMKNVGTDNRLMLVNPNVRSAYLSDIYSEVPNSSSSYIVSSESVPFYQMVFHGYAEYSAPPINYSGNTVTAILKCAEYGSSPNFMLAYNTGDGQILEQDSELYAASYEKWLYTASEAYSMLNEILAPVSGQLIVSHTQPVSGVYLTRYENGKAVYVNYNKQAVAVGSVKIDGQSAVLTDG